MKQVWILTLVTLMTSVAFAGSSKSISDSLVEGLSCKNLSVTAILSRVRPNAFSVANHIPYRNWEFRSKAATLGVCWGLSSTQRKLFYLLRTGHKNPPPVDIENTLNMIASDEGRFTYKVIPVRDKSLVHGFQMMGSGSFFESLLVGLPGQGFFKSEVEQSQKSHFYRGRNLKMGVGGGPLSPDKNRATLNALLNNLKMNRLTLLNLRLRALVQHIVVAKSFKLDKRGNVLINVYDSNYPEQENQIYFSRETGHFYAPQILGHFVGDASGTDYSHPLGVFIVDEAERTQMEYALLKHYQKLCR